VIAAFAAVYVVWGSTYLAIRYAVMTIPPFLMAGGRFLISGAILYTLARMRGSPNPTKREWRDATISGALMLFAGNGAVGWAEQRLTSGLAALIVAVVPLWMVVFEWLRPGGIRPSWTTMLGVIVGLAGLVVLVGPNTILGHGDIDAMATFVLMIGSIAWAAGSIFYRHSAVPSSGAMATGIQMLGGSFVLIVASALFGELGGFSFAEVSRQSWIGWVYLVTFGSLVGFTAYMYLLKAVSPAKASTYAYVNPVVAVFLGWAIANEAVTPRMLAGAAVILGAVAMITKANGGRRMATRD
jgi:drug/metabolite transporter (DMT)-like permease